MEVVLSLLIGQGLASSAYEIGMELGVNTPSASLNREHDGGALRSVPTGWLAPTDEPPGKRHSCRVDATDVPDIVRRQAWPTRIGPVTLRATVDRNVDFRWTSYRKGSRGEGLGRRSRTVHH